MEAVAVADLRKDFAGENALAGVSFSVAPGTLFGIIGADGAGKTTLMRILTTLLTPDSGSVSVIGYDTSRQHMEIRKRVGYMPQRFSLYEDLSVAENLFFFADVFNVKGRERSERIERLLSFSRLGPHHKRRARNLSGGMKQKLALCCALVHTPELLILDEPTTGVDPLSRREFWAILRDLKSQGLTIVVSTPYMDEAEHCDHLALFHRGTILLSGTPEGLLATFPLRLYAVSSHVRSLSYPKDTALPRGISYVFPSAGELHLAGDAPAESMPEILQQVQAVNPLADAIAPIRPKAEDLFFYVLSTVENASPAAPPAQEKSHGHRHRLHH